MEYCRLSSLLKQLKVNDPKDIHKDMSLHTYVIDLPGVQAQDVKVHVSEGRFLIIEAQGCRETVSHMDAKFERIWKKHREDMEEMKRKSPEELEEICRKGKEKVEAIRRKSQEKVEEIRRNGQEENAEFHRKSQEKVEELRRKGQEENAEFERMSQEWVKQSRENLEIYREASRKIWARSPQSPDKSGGIKKEKSRSVFGAFFRGSGSTTSKQN